MARGVLRSAFSARPSHIVDLTYTRRARSNRARRVVFMAARCRSAVPLLLFLFSIVWLVIGHQYARKGRCELCVALPNNRRVAYNWRSRE